MLSDHFTLADLKYNTLVPYCEGELVLGDLRGRYNKILAYVLSHYKILCSFFGLKSCLPSMPCSFCGAWVPEPSWHRCEERCVNAEGIARLHYGDDIHCSRSWDGTYWFFFCDQCKTSKPHIWGVLRNARIWHSPYNGWIDYTTESEYSYFSSAEGESCTLEEMEVEYSVEETARIEALRNRAVECFSTRLITEKLVINLTAYTEIKLYRTCKYIYLGNRARINWWVNMDQMIQKASGNDSDNNNNAGPSSEGAQ